MSWNKRGPWRPSLTFYTGSAMFTSLRRQRAHVHFIIARWPRSRSEPFRSGCTLNIFSDSVLNVDRVAGDGITRDRQTKINNEETWKMWHLTKGLLIGLTGGERNKTGWGKGLDEQERCSSDFRSSWCTKTHFLVNQPPGPKLHIIFFCK